MSGKRALDISFQDALGSGVARWGRGAERRSRASLALFILVALSLGIPACDHSDTSGCFQHAGSSVFTNHFGPCFHRPFDVVATDMDLDGDPDLLINWHQHVPLELFENKNGVFERINPTYNDVSGLFDHRDIPYLFADTAEIAPRIRRSGTPGLYLWHEPIRKQGGWYFLWRNEVKRYGGMYLELESNCPIGGTEGLVPEEIERPDERRLRITIADSSVERLFRVQISTTSQLKLQLRSDRSGGTPALFAGYTLTPITSGRLDVWTPDPHGVAWVDVEGTRHPELYITRGMRKGTIRPPFDGKVDRYYIHRGGNGPFYRMADPGVVPSDCGRGRRVEWVDVDNDGTFELSIGDKSTPNRLLVRDRASGTFRDSAPQFGLDLEGADVNCWGDLNGDGFQDFFYLEPGAVHVMLNRDGSHFERVSGETLGLVLPVINNDESVVFTYTALNLADFDNDGHLDLWVFGYGRHHTNHLFLRNRELFTDISEEVGLTSVRYNTVVILTDVDNDGFEDAISFGLERHPYPSRIFNSLAARVLGRQRPPMKPRATLWKNRAGKKFEFIRLPADVVPERIYVAAACDANSDGRTDLVLVGSERHLILNTTDEGNAFLDVELRGEVREPIGATVRASYSDGTATVRRYGSVHNTAFSQALQPLHFGIRKDSKLKTIGVRWPGESEETLYEVRKLNTLQVIEK